MSLWRTSNQSAQSVRLADFFAASSSRRVSSRSRPKKGDPNDVIYDNPYFQRKTQRQHGCQIDYLIQTRDKTLYICEIKFSRNPVPVGVGREVAEKVARLQIPRGMSYRTVIIHSGQISRDLDEGEFFSAKIDVARLLS